MLLVGFARQPAYGHYYSLYAVFGFAFVWVCLEPRAGFRGGNRWGFHGHADYFMDTLIIFVLILLFSLVIPGHVLNRRVRKDVSGKGGE